MKDTTLNHPLDFAQISSPLTGKTYEKWPFKETSELHNTAACSCIMLQPHVSVSSD
jgi:hypothetical protein